MCAPKWLKHFDTKSDLEYANRIAVSYLLLSVRFKNVGLKQRATVSVGWKQRLAVLGRLLYLTWKKCRDELLLAQAKRSIEGDNHNRVPSASIVAGK